MLAAALWALAATQIERFVNRVDDLPLPEVSAEARALHDGAFVADLHADSLLFGRDLARRSPLGHADLPRLREGGVALQVFGVATLVPWAANIDRTEAGGLETLTLLGCLKLSPFCWGGPFARLEIQASWLGRAVAHDPRMLWIRTTDDLLQLQIERSVDPAWIGGLLAIEGAHALEDDPANLERAFALGVRMIGLAHFFDNAYAGSAHGVEQGGLTPLGRATLERMEALGITADLAHLSAAAQQEWLAAATKPVVVSHGGARGTCDNARTLSDDQIRAIARGGGVVGIGFWPLAVCGNAPADVARAIRYVADLVGSDHVALGSDYDGGTRVGFDASRLPALTQALLDAGLDADAVRKVLGENVLRVLRANLPRKSSPAGRTTNP